MSYHEGTNYGEKNGYGKNDKPAKIKIGDHVDYTYNGSKKTNKRVRAVDYEAGILHVQWSEMTSIWINIDQCKISK